MVAVGCQRLISQRRISQRIHAVSLTLEGEKGEKAIGPPPAPPPPNAASAPWDMAVISAESASEKRYPMSGQPPGPGRAVRPVSPAASMGEAAMPEQVRAREAMPEKQDDCEDRIKRSADRSRRISKGFLLQPV